MEESKMEKRAFKFARPEHFKKFRFMNDEELFSALLRQKKPRQLRSLRASVKGLIDKSKSPRGHLRDIVKKKKEKELYGTAATIYDTPQGKAIGLGENYRNKPHLRELIAHESWHTNVPVLGHSELLAHAYGGARAKKGATIGEKAKGAFEMLKHLKETRPGLMAFEVGYPMLVGTEIELIRREIKKHKKAKKQKT